MEVLDRRALNRATLARQLLLDRSAMSVPEAVEHLAGLQAQTPHSWYVGLWTRLRDFSPPGASDLLADGRLVRVAAMRSTIHLMTGRDALAVRPLVAVVGERMWATNFGRKLTSHDDLASIVAEGCRVLAAEPLTFADLGKRLAERWPGHDAAAMAQAVRVFETLIQVPPRGLWGRSGRALHTTAATWLPGLSAEPLTVAELLLRYLRAFGPATVQDMQTWSGLTRLAGVVDGLRPRLVTFADEQGRELFDLPDAPRPGPDAAAPARFLYDFDNLLLSHADRTRVVTAEFAGEPFDPHGPIPAVVLVDGTTAAVWRVGRSKELVVAPLRPLARHEIDDVTAEGARLLAFLHPKATAPVRLVEGGWPALLAATA
ncbi:winged helix DNA-binding domain-containing protein [Dactylosporangium sp. AC04546]|uniref:winged helix DNA-binding domain-containing protein n=1 Tax=Dactylosporangium sp. AC04546 TaxID=2862460 RepID=UPI001EDFA2CC|nr:winged helix DNA-binding domain-containing protein [Dactylosporangium sp. AC04546]WVK82032.1 winged helix DNA-binding domain-containing protein [Dactylosporangium sp. AC04546]